MGSVYWLTSFCLPEFLWQTEWHNNEIIMIILLLLLILFVCSIRCLLLTSYECVKKANFNSCVKVACLIAE